MVAVGMRILFGSDSHIRQPSRGIALYYCAYGCRVRDSASETNAELGLPNLCV